MSRGSVFKLSGNLALGGNDTYSTNQLQSIKSSLRLLKARQSQKKSQQNIDMNNNYGGSYSSNTNQRSELKRNDNNDYNYYQSNAKNHVPQNSYDNNYGNGYDQYQNKGNSRNSVQQNQRNFQSRDKNTNYSIPRNDPMTSNPHSKNNYNPYPNNEPMTNKEQSARNPLKARTQQPKNYNQQQQYYDNKPQNKNQQNINVKAQTRPPLRKQQLNQQTPNHTIPNQEEEPTIKQANRQNKQEIVQHDPSTFVQCTVGCGRKFNPDSISKHEAICYKVFQKKRKQFNAQDQRILDAEHKTIVKNVIVQEKRNTALQKKNPAKNAKNQQKMSKWKAQSLAFRSMIKDNNGEQVSAQQKQKLQQIKNIGMIKCPHCARTFNDTAGPKHITFCQTQSRKNKMKK